MRWDFLGMKRLYDYGFGNGICIEGLVGKK